MCDNHNSPLQLRTRPNPFSHRTMPLLLSSELINRSQNNTRIRWGASSASPTIKNDKNKKEIPKKKVKSESSHVTKRPHQNWKGVFFRNPATDCAFSVDPVGLGLAEFTVPVCHGHGTPFSLVSTPSPSLPRWGIPWTETGQGVFQSSFPGPRQQLAYSRGYSSCSFIIGVHEPPLVPPTRSRPAACERSALPPKMPTNDASWPVVLHVCDKDAAVPDFSRAEYRTHWSYHLLLTLYSARRRR